MAVPLRGLDARRNYEVSFEDTPDKTTVPGATLSALPVEILASPGSAIYCITGRGIEPALAGTPREGFRTSQNADVSAKRPCPLWLVLAVESPVTLPLSLRPCSHLRDRCSQRLDAHHSGRGRQDLLGFVV